MSQGDSAPMQVGELRIHAESPAVMMMFDGQHRRRAIQGRACGTLGQCPAGQQALRP